MYCIEAFCVVLQYSIYLLYLICSFSRHGNTYYTIVIVSESRSCVQLAVRVLTTRLLLLACSGAGDFLRHATEIKLASVSSHCSEPRVFGHLDILGRNLGCYMEVVHLFLAVGRSRGNHANLDRGSWKLPNHRVSLSSSARSHHVVA